MSNQTWQNYFKDHLGNTRVAFRNNGGTPEIIQCDQYYPFGLTVNLSVTGDENKFKYNGKELEDEPGLYWYHYGARYYDPQLGRWHTMDPADEFNSPYLYVGNNPILWIDPDGAQAVTWDQAFEAGPGASNVFTNPNYAYDSFLGHYCLRTEDQLDHWLVQFSLGRALSWGFMGSYHFESNIGVSIDLTDFWNTKFFGNIQEAVTFGLGAQGYAAGQLGFSISHTPQLKTGLSNQFSLFGEANLGVEKMMGGSINIPYDTNTKRLVGFGVGTSYKIKGGMGAAGYIWVGTSATHYVTS